ncbi:MAG TPA: hypothetical protein VK997_03410 [Deferrisomatales bacterium]|nr:hypothetical protein [Deferrisomatales bacterium]
MSPFEPAVLRLALGGLRLPLDHPPNWLPQLAADRLGVEPARVRRWEILRRSLDARGRRKPCWEYRIGLELAAGQGEAAPGGAQPWPPAPPLPVPLRVRVKSRPLVVGGGPAGLFAALRLCAHGVPPLVLERGDPVEQRVRRVAAYWRRGEFDPESNVQFGEGGAGAFSDGKLTYRGKDPRRGWLLDQLVALGAPPETRFDARAHLGTDRLRRLLVGLRRNLLAAGCAIRFRTRVDELVLEEGRVAGVRVGGAPVLGTPVFLAPGHSARDFVAALVGQGTTATAKGFALGVRVELPQAAVARQQFGSWAGEPSLPAAEFAVRARAGEGRDVYSFCMCPGGVVIPAGSEADGLVLNGMSGAARGGASANAALVVGTEPEDWGGEPLGGYALQRHWEREARRLGGPRGVPGQRVADFLAGRPSRDLPASRCPWPPVPAPLDRCLPPFAAAALREALPKLIRQLPPLADGLLLGVETRTSSPVRLLRGTDFQSVSTPGLYPLGEGAGYAGGIVSSALDGIAAADAWVASLDTEAGT